MRHGFGRLILHALPRDPPGVTVNELYARFDQHFANPSATTLRKHLAQLIHMEVVQRQAGARGEHRYWRVTDSVLDAQPAEAVHA